VLSQLAYLTADHQSMFSTGPVLLALLVVQLVPVVL
jgi:hypothetical protein